MWGTSVRRDLFHFSAIELQFWISLFFVFRIKVFQCLKWYFCKFLRILNFKKILKVCVCQIVCLTSVIFVPTHFQVSFFRIIQDGSSFVNSDYLTSWPSIRSQAIIPPITPGQNAKTKNKDSSEILFSRNLRAVRLFPGEHSKLHSERSD